MGKYIGRIYKYSQSQISTFSPKAPVGSSSASQIPSAAESTTTPVPYVRDKNQNNYVLYSPNIIHNDVNITNNDDVQYFETEGKNNYSIPTTSIPNHHTQLFDTTSESILNLHTPTILPPVGK